MTFSNNGRRKFIKNTLLGAAGVASTSLLSACSTFDDFLFDDNRDFNDEVLIIGGGVAGLYLAYKLRKSNTEYRLFEGSSQIGGRIRSYSGSDYGASLISTHHLEANKLIKEMGLQSRVLDKDAIYLPEGMQSLTDALFEKTVGLIPYRSYRLRTKLVEIQKYSSGYDLVFQTPSIQRRYGCNKLALAIPPAQWGSVRGLLDLPEMAWAKEWIKTLQFENTVKIILPSSTSSVALKPHQTMTIGDLEIRQIVKKNKTVPSLEIDIRHPQEIDLDFDAIADILKNKLNITVPFSKLSPEQFFDWSQVELIRGSTFKNDVPLPEMTSNNFQIIGDFASIKAPYSIEGALLSAKRASGLLL